MCARPLSVDSRNLVVVRFLVLEKSTELMEIILEVSCIKITLDLRSHKCLLEGTSGSHSLQPPV